MIWSDRDLLRELRSGERAKIEPFDEKAVQPASIDLRLGNVFWLYKERPTSRFVLDPEDLPVIDVTQSAKDLMFRVVKVQSIVLNPQNFILGSTQERVSLGNDVVARIEGKSSLGRLGLTIHSTAGFIDPGNQNLSLTLELFNMSPLPIRLHVGMWICQLAFQDLRTPCEVPYGPARNSRYFGDAEPVPSLVNHNVGFSEHPEDSAQGKAEVNKMLLKKQGG